MKKLLFFFVAILLIAPKAQAALETYPVAFYEGDVSNLSIKYTTEITGAVTAEFTWTTYGTSGGDSSIRLLLKTGNTGQTVGGRQNCSSATLHCYKFPNLVNGATYQYTIDNVDSVEGYTQRDIIIQSGQILYPGRVFNLAIAGSDPEHKSIRKGESATYQFQFANTGNFDDSYQISIENSSPIVSSVVSASSVAGLRAGFRSSIMSLTLTANSDSSSDQDISGDIVVTSTNIVTPKVIKIPFRAKVLAAVAQTTADTQQQTQTQTDTTTDTTRSTTTPPPSTQSSPPPSPTPPSSTTQVSTAPVLLEGTVIYPDGTLASGALVSVWASEGAHAPATVGANGRFSFQIVRDSVWRLTAFKTDGTIGYKSNMMSVSVGNKTVDDVVITLNPIPKQIPPPSVVQRATTERITTSLIDGASIDIPPSAIASTGNITLNVRPTVEVHEYASRRVVGIAYDITISDQAGAEVRTFTQPIDVVLPFDDATLASLQVDADNLVPNYFNEVTRRWVPIPTFTIDKVNKRVIAKVTHLTRFALISAADITPPNPPTNINAIKTASGVVLTWVNPTTDFRNAKIYRSSEAGKLGSVIFAEVFGNNATDKAASAGTTYYYLVRAVDPAGNESTNIEQVSSAGVSAVSTSSSSRFSRSLKRGISGDDVTLLQQLLIKENVYPEALVTGYFGPLTHSAVIRLQEKYLSEILTPVDLVKGTGYFGPSSIKKANELLSKHSL